MRSASNWFGLRCSLQMCPFRIHENTYGIGGKCALGCGKIAGWTTREAIRAYADREIAARTTKDTPNED